MKNTQNKLLLGLAGALLVGLGVVASVSAGFGLSLAHADTATSTEPVVSGVSVTPTDTSATVSWTTDQPADSQVAYGTSLPYTASSTLDSGLVTNHSQVLTGLLPDTAYHYAVMSANGSSTTPTMSADGTFMTTASSTSTTTMPMLSLSPMSGPAGTTVAVTGSGFAPSEGVSLSANGITTSITTDANGNFSTSWTVPSVSAGSLLVTALGGTSNNEAVDSFSVTSTATTTGDDLSALEAQVAQLQSEVSTLQTQVAALMAGTSTGVGGTTGGSAATIDQNGQSVGVGSVLDFGGRNFNHEENVTVTLNGQQVATAHADGGGNFSTGNIYGPTVAGTYTYVFTGASGDSAQATITVH